ncbi:hypothetical protein [Tessaracoccus sp. OH4464_COT-324]|uniref:hypothetical protein n=1 Tax=Tessaracoccus sp. OH4464_COT-324 TaxID=2491059 RepID=UPI000F63483C|nr:hypothetical protein [Tessaracoccus sp. OH4464_COT-324]RRD47841.1 hypothetical protein EII42_00900 [Tessaracoccus sp. OH4464_COT-324]
MTSPHAHPLPDDDRGYYPPPSSPDYGAGLPNTPYAQQPFPPQPPYEYPVPPIAPGYPYRLPRKEHSIGLHVLLFMFTGGVGNVLYWLWIENENRRRGY